MANQYLTSDLLSKEAAAVFEVNQTFLATANRKYEGLYEQMEFKPGDTVRLRLDNRYLVQRGDSVTAQDIIDKSLNMTIQPLFSIPILYKPTDLQREIADFSQQFIQPAIRTITAEMNRTIAAGAIGTLYQFNGAVGTPINSFASVNALRGDMADMAIPERLTWYDVLRLADSVALQNSLSNYFNEPINTDILRNGMLGRLAGFDVFEDQSIATHAGNPAAVGTPVVNGAVSSGNTIVTAGWSASYEIKAGTVLTFTDPTGNPKAVSPVLHSSVSRDFSVVVTADVTATAGGDATLTVSPTIDSSATSAYQNVSKPIADAATINVYQNYNANIAYSDMGLYVATPRLQKMDSPDSSVFTDTDTGISVRVSKTAEVLDNQNVLRLDVQMAYAWNPEMAFLHIS